MKTAVAATGPDNIGNLPEFPIRERAEIVIDVMGSRFKIVSHPPAPQARVQVSRMLQTALASSWPMMGRDVTEFQRL